MPDQGAAATAATVRAALRDVFDPELPISIVDLGLIRGVEMQGSTARVKLTYTTLGCPCTDIIQEAIEERLMKVQGVDRVEIEESFEPWTSGDISSRGIRQLRVIGLT